MAKADLSDADIAAMLAAEDQYIKDRKAQKQKSTRDIFHAGFHFGVAHARRATVAEGTPAPSAPVFDNDDDEPADD